MQEHTALMTAHYVSSRALNNNSERGGKTTTNVCHLHLPVTLTEDNDSRTASPCCLALGVSACVRLSKCTQCATVDHWQHHPRPVLQPAVTDECPHTVWLSDQSVWLTKTGLRAESFSVSCHFFLSILFVCLSFPQMFDPFPVYLYSYWPRYQIVHFCIDLRHSLNYR